MIEKKNMYLMVADKIDCLIDGTVGLARLIDLLQAASLKIKIMY